MVTTPAFHFFDHQRAALRESSPRTEITWLVPDSRLEDEMVPGVAQTRRLDIDAEIVKYGAATQGGPRGDRALMARMMAVLSAQSR